MFVENNRFLAFIIIFTILYTAVIPLVSDEIPEFSILTESWEPYNYEENGVIKGISVDILLLVLKRIGSDQGIDDITLMPWARAYQYLQSKEETLLFTTIRTAEREDLFKWVGPIFEMEFSVYALKSKNIIINSVEDLADYKFGTLRGDATESLLVKNAGLDVGDFYQTSSSLQITKMLASGRIDMVARSLDTMVTTCREAGLDLNDFETIFTLDKKSMYYAFHKDTSDPIISLFQNAFNEIKEEGITVEIFLKYEK